VEIYIVAVSRLQQRSTNALARIYDGCTDLREVVRWVKSEEECVERRVERARGAELSQPHSILVYMVGAIKPTHVSFFLFHHSHNYFFCQSFYVLAKKLSQLIFLRRHFVLVFFSTNEAQHESCVQSGSCVAMLVGRTFTNRSAW
jgi:hypothetical protein